MKKINNILNQLKAELNGMGNEDLTNFNDCDAALELIKNALHDLRGIVVNNSFNTVEDEIVFFREIKPFIMSRFLLLTFVIQYDNLHFISPKSAEDYVKRMLKEKKSFLAEYETYIIQLKSCSSKKEGEYFVRNQFSPPICSVYSEVLLNIHFCTFHSEVLSIFKSYKLIQNFLDQKKENSIRLHLGNQLKWTKNKTALIELIYALHYSNAVNSGNSSIKELKNVFETVFNVKLGNVYRAFHDFKSREIRTPFITSLRNAMENKLDEDDAFIP